MALVIKDFADTDSQTRLVGQAFAKHAITTADVLTVGLDFGYRCRPGQVEVWCSGTPADIFYIEGSITGEDGTWRRSATTIVIPAGGEIIAGFLNAWRFIRLTTGAVAGAFEAEICGGA